MSFKVFDLSGVIESYNDRCQKSLDPSFDFGLKCFGGDLIDSMRSATITIVPFVSSYSGDFSQLKESELGKIAENLSVISGYYDASALEVNAAHKDIPSLIVNEFSAYLIELDKDIKRTRDLLCNEMLVRMNKKMSPDFCNYAHDYIWAMGFQTHQDSLLKMGWIAKSVFTQLICRSDKYFIAPKKIVSEGLIPSSVWFKSIFKGRNFRLSLFQDKTWFFVKLYKITKEKVEYNKLDANEIVASLKECDQVLAEINNIDNLCDYWNPQGIWEYLSGSLFKFCQCWFDFSEANRKSINGSKLALIGAYCNLISAKKMDSKSLQMELPKGQLSYIVKSLDAMIGSCDVSLRKQLKIHRSVLKKLLDGDANDSEKSTENKVSDHSYFSMFKVFKGLSLMELSDKHFSKIKDSVQYAAMDLEKMKTRTSKKQLESLLQPIFLDYLKYSISMIEKGKFDPDAEKIKTVEYLLQMFASPDVVRRLCSLISVRSQGDPGSIYQTMCESYMASYAINADAKTKSIAALNAVIGDFEICNKLDMASA